MHVLAIVVDMLAVFVAGSLGAMLRPKIPVSWKRVMVQCCGLLAIGLGGWGVIRQITDVTADSPEIEGSLLVILALVLGGVVGYALFMPSLMTRLAKAGRSLFEGDRAHKKTSSASASRKSSDGIDGETAGDLVLVDAPALQTGDRYCDGFVLATMLVTSGSLLVTGLLDGSMTAHYVKVGVDALFVLVLGMVYGDGASLSAVPLAATNGLLAALHAGGKAFVSSNLLNMKIDAWEASNGREITETKLAELTEAVEKTVATWNQEVIAQAAVLAAAILLIVGVVMAAEKKWKLTQLLPAYIVLYAYQWIVPVITAAIKG